jgi:hypothetical protein
MQSSLRRLLWSTPLFTRKFLGLSCCSELLHFCEDCAGRELITCHLSLPPVEDPTLGRVNEAPNLATQ